MSNMPSPPRYFFDEIVGLRIVLALWVAIGHGMQLSGFVTPTNFVSAVLSHEHSAVVVFIIISGFVITNLLLGKQESYPRYITRRFFRLYPAYVLCCVLGFYVSGAWLHIVQTASWQDAVGWAEYSQSIFELYHEANSNFWPHFWLHATMMHGAVPDEVINRGAMVFLPAAWSISLEWQFYLVAPFVIMALRQTWSMLLMLGLATMAFLAYKFGYLGSYDIKSSLAIATPAFFVGIVCRLAYPKLKQWGKVSPLLASAIVIFVCATSIEKPLPYLVWGIFFSFLVWSENAAITGGLFRRIFRSKPAQILGDASYSLYLVHRPIQVALGVAVLSVVPLTGPAMLAVQLAAVVIAIPISIMMYHWIEKPGIELGARVAARLPAAAVTDGTGGYSPAKP